VADQHFKIISGGGLEWLQCAALARIPWLVHAFSTRKGGFSCPPAGPTEPKALNLGAVNWDRPATVQKNRQVMLRQIGADGFSLAMLRQIHSADIFGAARGRAGEIDYRPAGLPGSLEFEAIPIAEKTSAHLSQTEKAPDETGRRTVEPRVAQGPVRRPVPTGVGPPGDALLTDEPRILLSIRTADCLPILLVDPQRRAIAAVHAGWRGALARIAEKAVGDMRREFYSRPDDLIAVIGPSIRRCCYEVQQDVVNAFEGRFAPSGFRQDLDKFFSKVPSSPLSSASQVPVSGFLAAGPPGHGPQKTKPVHLDLVAVARYQLVRAGVPPAQVHVAEFCTACRTDLFFSHRKEGSLAGRMMAVIGIRE
jgi:YfiH family protein